MSAVLLDEVEDVVERADQRVDVLAVERRDERRLEPMADVVADLVAAVLRRPGSRRLALGLVVASGASPPAGARRAEDVRGVLDEQVEEPLLARDQAQAHGFLREWRRWLGAGAEGSSISRSSTAYRGQPACAMLGRWTGPSSPSSPPGDRCSRSPSGSALARGRELDDDPRADRSAERGRRPRGARPARFRSG